MDAERILIILLSICLIIFLIIAIVFFAQLIKVTKHLQSLSEKVDEAADNVVSVSETFRKIATPVAIGGLIGKVTEKIFHTKQRKGK